MLRVISITPDQAVQRALSMLLLVPVPPKGAPQDAGNRPGAYRLDSSGQLGGDDPSAPMCFDWSFGDRTPTADCIGLVLWSSGLARQQPGYQGSRGDWLNCASLVDDAATARRWSIPVDEANAHPGDWLLSRDHISMVLRPATRVSDTLVIDCSPRHGRQTAVGVGLPWSEACRVVRPRHYLVAA